MSLDVRVGPRASLIREDPEAAHLLHLSSPVLRLRDLRAIELLEDPAFRSVRVSATFSTSHGAEALESAIGRVCHEAESAVESGAQLLVLTDEAISPGQAPIPMLLGVGAVHHALVSNLRGKIWEIVRISSEQQIFELCIRALGQEEAMSPASVDSTTPIR